MRPAGWTRTPPPRCGCADHRIHLGARLLTRSIRDAHLFFETVEGPYARPHLAAGFPARRLSPDQPRLAATLDSAFAPISAVVATGFQAAVARLEDGLGPIA